jgi:hypothetical protein
MKTIAKLVAVALIGVAPAFAFAQAQPQQGLTRAQVRADLVRLEQAGYQPNDWVHYPENIQQAERIAAQQDAARAQQAQ